MWTRAGAALQMAACGCIARNGRREGGGGRGAEERAGGWQRRRMKKLKRVAAVPVTIKIEGRGGTQLLLAAKSGERESAAKFNFKNQISAAKYRSRGRGTPSCAL